MRPAALLAGAVLAAACAHAPARGPRPRLETAEGWAPAVKADPAGTRRRALVAALRSAVEQATGVEVRARTVVAGALAVEDRLRARTAGAVKSYEILSETEEEGFHKTRVRALVDPDPPAGEDRPAPPPGDPTVAVALTGPGAASAAAGVRRGLIERGFTVVDGGKADILVNGESAVSSRGFVGPFNSSRASVRLEARAAKGRRVLWSSRREAAAVGTAPDSADSKASETAGLLGGEDLAKGVAADLESRSPGEPAED
jgi:hypothetical protein